MDRLSGWLLLWTAVCVFVRPSHCVAAGTCKDGICEGFTVPEVTRDTVDIVPPPVYLNEEGTCFFRSTSRAIVPDKGGPYGGWYIHRGASPSEFDYIAKILSEQRKFGPEITAQDILDLLETVRERKSET